MTMKNKFTEYEKKVIHTALLKLLDKIHDNALTKDDVEYLETNNRYVLMKVINDIERNNLLK